MSGPLGPEEEVIASARAQHEGVDPESQLVQQPVGKQQIGDRPEAVLDDVCTVLRLAPRSPLAFWGLSLAYAARGDVARYSENLDSLIGVAPSFPMPYALRGTVHLLKGELDRAIDQLRHPVGDYFAVVGSYQGTVATGAAAKLEVHLTTGGGLAFCGHHANKHGAELFRLADKITVEDGFEWAGKQAS